METEKLLCWQIKLPDTKAKCASFTRYKEKKKLYSRGF